LKNKMDNWTPHKKILKFSIFFSIFSILLYFLGLFFIYHHIQNKQSFEYGNESQSSKEERFWTIKSIVENNKDSIKILNDFFVSKSDEVGFIKKIEETAKNSEIDFEITSIDVKNDTVNPNPIKEDMSIQIKFKGSWNNIMTFVNKLEKLNFGVSISGLNIDLDENGNWAGNASLLVFKEK